MTTLTTPTAKNRPFATFLALTLTLGALPAVADVVWEQRIESDGFGSRHVGRMKSTSKLVVSDEKAREETTSEFTGKFLGKLSSDMGSLNITRLDKGLIWSVNEQRGEYWEMTFEMMRKQQEEAMANMQSMKAQQPTGDGATAGETPPPTTYEWSEPEITVNETDRTETIAGLTAKLTEVRVKTVGTHVETGQTCEVNWELDQWLGKETAASKQLMAYYRKYAEQLGFSAKEMQGVGQQVMGMLSSYGQGMDDLVGHLTTADGIGLRHTMRLRVGGSCGATGGTGSGAAPSPMGEVKKSFARFKGKFGRGKKKQEEPATVQPTATEVEPEWRQMFSLTTETVSIREEDAADAMYAEPTHLKKVEPRTVPQGS